MKPSTDSGGKDIRTTDFPKHEKHDTWEEQSGLLDFLRGVRAEALRFADALGFELETDLPQPRAIDGDSARPRGLGFMVARRNSIISSRTYCLYTLIEGRELGAYIGVIAGDNIVTVRELNPLADFGKGQAALYEWLRALLKASCEKP
jgi:hypothetical protein